jgi:hypothetical protein
MLFLIMQTHDLDHCPAKEGRDSLKEYYRSLQADIAEKLGVEVLGLYTAPLHHAQFLILQADDFESLSEYLHPLYERGRVEVFPATSFSERIHALQEGTEPHLKDYYCMTCRHGFFETETANHKDHKFYTEKEMEETWPHEFGGEAGGG